MFRKLYWVTERVHPDGTSQITGVYTSIPNLVKEGMACNEDGCLRLTLSKLDSDTEPLASWTAPDFEGLRDRLNEFVRTDEFSAEQCDTLMATLENRKASV